MNELDPTYVLDSLRKLRGAQPEVFGKSGHNFRLNPTLDEATVAHFEAKHRIRLPADYRLFITKIGNGGAGPYCEVFPFGEMDGNFGKRQSWSEGDGFVGVLSEPFPHSEARDDQLEYPPEELQQADEAEYERQLDELEATYFATLRMSGAFPICHEGCAIRIWLVVSGPEAGHLWEDDRANGKGIRPVLLRDGNRATFASWYLEWLEKALAAPPGPSRFRPFLRRLIGR